MKKLFACLLLAAFFAASTLLALPPAQHALKGIVDSIDVEKRILIVKPGKKDSPTEFAIIEGRTKLRRDQQPAALTDLMAGQTVRLYYVREKGQCVATEVTWSSAQQ